jgi:hypothetical protein
MFGCTVDGGITPAIRGTKGIKEVPVRTAVGVVELTLDYPMGIGEYSVAGAVTEAAGEVTFVKTLTNGVAKIVARTYAGGEAADLDFDVMVFRYAAIT